jgi:hypothetical protein
MVASCPEEAEARRRLANLGRHAGKKARKQALQEVEDAQPQPKHRLTHTHTPFQGKSVDPWDASGTPYPSATFQGFPEGLTLYPCQMEGGVYGGRSLMFGLSAILGATVLLDTGKPEDTLRLPHLDGEEPES